LTGQDGLYISSSKNENTYKVSIKLANTEKVAKRIEIDLKDFVGKNAVSAKQIILKAPLAAENTLENPDLVVPIEKTVSIENGQLKLSVEAESFNVFVIEIK
jgi:alpha-L-arabinofuranosidase